MTAPLGLPDPYRATGSASFVDFLAALHKPKKVTPATVELLDTPGLLPGTHGDNPQRLALIPAAGFPNGDRSHFAVQRKMDEGLDNGAVGSGWLARHLNTTVSPPPVGLRAASMGSGQRSMSGSSVAVTMSNLDSFRVNGFRGNGGAIRAALQDLHVVDGDLPHPRLPVVPGHEIVGVVDQLGPHAVVVVAVELVLVAPGVGEIEQIGLRSTKIMTPDDTLVTVPNSEVLGNFTYNANAGVPECLVVTEVFLPATVDPDVVIRIGKEVAVSCPYTHLGRRMAIMLSDNFSETPYQTRMKALGIKDEMALQSWFIRRMDVFLNEHGRTLIGWDETLAISTAAPGALPSTTEAVLAAAPRAFLKYFPAFKTGVVERGEVLADGFWRSPSTCSAVTSDM